MNISFSYSKTALMIALGASTLFSCKDDEPDDVTTDPVAEIPATYNFDNASYSGQTIRLNQLADLTTEMKTGNSGDVLNETELLDMFEGADNAFDFDSDGKQLSNKADEEARTIIEGWISDLVEASVAADTNDADATSGARVLTSSDGANNYLVAANGFEYTQLIEKGIMGGVFYYQATSNYLDGIESDDNSANAEGKDYTDMEQNYDEAFGYFGAPTDFSSTNTTDSRYHAKYSLKGQDAGLNTTDDLMDAFIAGRYYIGEDDMTSLASEITVIKSKWEEVLYTTAIHYLNGASSDHTDEALRCHQLSKAYAFIWSLNFNVDKSVSASDVQATLDLMGDDFFDISTADISATKAKLVALFGLDATTADAL